MLNYAGNADEAGETLEANLEAKRGTSLTQSMAPMDLNSACASVKRHQQSVADDRYLSDPHGRIHRCSLAVSNSSNAANVTGPETST